MYLGFYIGHSHFFNHAEVLIESIKKNVEDMEIVVMINPELENIYLESAIGKYKYLLSKTCNKLPFADKMHAGKVFEDYLDGKGFIWMDVDSFFNNQFMIKELKKAIYINPVDKRNIGVRYNNLPSPLLDIIYNHLKIDATELRPLTTTISREDIYPYFNIGFMVVNENRNIFGKSLEVMELLMDDEEVKELLDETYLNAVFFHQLVFSAIILREYCEQDICRLPEYVNYPLHLIDQDDHKPLVSDLVSFRYDNCFNGEINEELPEELLEHRESLNMIWYYQQNN